MLRPKRHQQQPHHYGDDHHGHTHGLAAHDELMRMDPSLMTERQQLAFLLRKTAQDASSSSSSSSDSGGVHESSEDDEQRVARAVARAGASAGGRRIQRGNAKSSPRNMNAMNNAGQLGKGVVIYCGRGRPPKNSIKLPPGQTSEEYKKLLSPKSAASAVKKEQRGESAAAATAVGMDHRRAHPPNRKKLKVTTTTTATTTASSTTTVAGGIIATAMDIVKSEKTSPSSSSDVLHMDSFEESDSSRAAMKTGGGRDFWRLHCALCCDSGNAHSAALDASSFFSDALFLCPSCDQKYPTQRALGRV